MIYLLVLTLIIFVVGVGCLLVDSWRTYQHSLHIKAAHEFLSDNHSEHYDFVEDLELGELSHQIL